MIEKEIPWAHVVEGDEIFSTIKHKWFEVVATEATTEGIKVRARGVAKYWPPQAPEKLVLVRRGDTGKAVDILVVAFSGEMRTK